MRPDAKGFKSHRCPAGARVKEELPDGGRLQLLQSRQRRRRHPTCRRSRFIRTGSYAWVPLEHSRHVDLAGVSKL